MPPGGKVEMSYRVLIVDDSKLARMAMAKMLAALRPGWSRIEATNADEAIARFAEIGPDLALVDFNMPGRNGLDLAAELRGLKPAMPLALISANTQHEIVAQAGQIGASFLPKPLDEQLLAEFLSEAEQRLEAAV
jgi:YesN/AraC family two-component response regulator